MFENPEGEKRFAALARPVPTAYFDGGYQCRVGSEITYATIEESIRLSGAREVPDLGLSLEMKWDEFNERLEMKVAYHPIVYHVFLIDRSGSMTLGDDGDGDRFERAIDMAIADIGDNVDDNDKLMIASFAWDTDHINPDFMDHTTGFVYKSSLGDITNYINSHLDEPVLADRTPFVKALIMSADELAGETGNIFMKKIWIYTDGMENNSRNLDPLSPTCGGCVPYLDNPVNNVVAGVNQLDCEIAGRNCNWYYDCDPADNPEFCSQYQECIVVRLIKDVDWHVTYFGDPINEEGVRVVENEAEYKHAESAEEKTDNNQTVNKVLSVQSTPDWGEDYYFLKYLADNSGGTVKYVCDDNIPPNFVSGCPDSWEATAGNTVMGTVVADDPDGFPITYSLTSTSPPGATIDKNSGVITWFIPDDYEGEYVLGIIAIDICSGADTCGITVNVVPQSPYTINIEKLHDVLQGHFVNVGITVGNSLLGMGGFDFLIAYDASALTFMEATPGQLLEDCGWEYFTYRYGFEGNCGDACPSGLLRIIAMAETNNGPNHPSCYGPPDTDPHELASMKFLVTNDRTFNCQYAPIYFFWADCADNSISSIDGQDLYIDRTVSDFEGNLIWDEDDDVQFPEDARLEFVGAPDYCLNPNPDKPSAERYIDFINGGIDIICSDSIDVKGDINCNHVRFEIADAVMFTNYFIFGVAAFDDHWEASVAASDVNNDGTPLSIADLVTLIRVITGDIPPDPRSLPEINEVTASTLINHSAVAVSVNSPVDIGGGYFEFAYSGYDIGEPRVINGASDMTVKYSAENGVLKILVYSMEEGRRIPAGAENILAVPISGEGSISLTEIELSDYFGNTLNLTVAEEPVLPADYALYQNYPNPFNATTTIMYELPAAGLVSVAVYNVLGQKVATLCDREETAGIHSVEWNSTDDAGETVASGIYIYRIMAGKFTAERKLLLLK